MVYTMNAAESPEHSGRLSDMDREILGAKEARLCIPLVSLPDLDVVEDQLAGLLSTVRILRKTHKGPERHALFQIQREVFRANRIINDQFKEVYERLKVKPPSRGGRPRNGE